MKRIALTLVALVCMVGAAQAQGHKHHGHHGHYRPQPRPVYVQPYYRPYYAPRPIYVQPAPAPGFQIWFSF